MSDDPLPTVSIHESLCLQFEQAWLNGQPHSIDSLLPQDAAHPAYLRTLEELIIIELELAWKSSRTKKTEAEATDKYIVERYIDRFPILNNSDSLTRLLIQEYQLRHRYGDRPGVDSYRRRFPHII